uniref:Secreted protein n=1 Tax=Globodera pallida TaxID=36090 RepID=A0A183CG40_GLOPA
MHLLAAIVQLLLLVLALCRCCNGMLNCGQSSSNGMPIVGTENQPSNTSKSVPPSTKFVGPEFSHLASSTSSETVMLYNKPEAGGSDANAQMYSVLNSDKWWPKPSSSNIAVNDPVTAPRTTMHSVSPKPSSSSIAVNDPVTAPRTTITYNRLPTEEAKNLVEPKKKDTDKENAS